MARLTVEDCLKYTNNRFDLILEASKRARQIARGAEPLVDRGNDKPTVIALREIAAGHAGYADEYEAEMEMLANQNQSLREGDERE